MEIRTYGVEGFMDWQCEIPVGRARAIVHFSGGTITAYGVTPAEYSTGNPVQQRIIENSSYFKSGRIKLLRTSGKADPVKHRESKPAPAPAKDAPVETPVKTEAEPMVQEGEDIAEDPIEQAEAEVEEEMPEAVEVSCLTDAQNYLRDHFGIPTSRSRSKEKAQEFARENGIAFVWL